MAQGGILGNGVKVAYSENSPQSWAEVPQLRNVAIPRLIGDRVEITTHSRTSNRKAYMPGLSDAEDPSFTTLSDFDPSTGPAYEQLREWQADGTEVWWRFEIPVNRARTLFRGVEFKAGVRDFSPGTPIDGAQTTDWTLSVGIDDIVWDAAAGATQL